MDNSCLALIAGKLGFATAEQQKAELYAFAAQTKMPVSALVDSAKFQKLDFPQVVEKLTKVQQAAIVVWRIDCLPVAALSMENLVELLAKLGKINITFISIQDGIDTDLSSAEVLTALAAAWKNYRRNRKVVNARASLAKASLRNTSFRTGRPKKRNDALIWSLRRKGLSIREIALKAKVSAKSVQRSLLALDKKASLEQNL